MCCMQKIREEKNILELFGDKWILWCNIKCNMQGRIQDFKLGWVHLKKIAPSGGRGENDWGISCEKSRFHAIKSYFFQFQRKVRKLLGYFVWKITILWQKNHIFSNFRAACAPLDSPLIWIRYSLQASIASTHRHVHVQIVVLGAFLHHSWLFFFVLQFDLHSLLQRRFFGPRYIGHDFLLGSRYIGDDFFRADRSLRAKQEGPTIVHF